jgi:hypothetical protein
MTINELMRWLEQFQGWIGLGLVAFPCVTYSLGALLKFWARPLARGFLAAAVCIAVIPGVSMAVLLLYMLLFTRVNLLREMHLVFHLLPVVSMVGTLWAASRLEALDTLPGVLRLQGLMVLVGLGFAGLLAVHNTFIGIHFFARFEHLLAILAGVVALWQFGVARLCRKSRT